MFKIFIFDLFLGSWVPNDGSPFACLSEQPNWFCGDLSNYINKPGAIWRVFGFGPSCWSFKRMGLPFGILLKLHPKTTELLTCCWCSSQPDGCSSLPDDIWALEKQKRNNSASMAAAARSWSASTEDHRELPCKIGYFQRSLCAVFALAQGKPNL